MEDSTENAGIYVKNYFKKKVSMNKFNKTQQIEVSPMTSKILSAGIILIMFITIIIGFTAISRSPQSVASIAGNEADIETFKVIEHLDNEQSEINKLKKVLKEMQEKINQNDASINSLNKRKNVNINRITQNRVIAPANRTSGTHYALGPLVVKSYPSEVLECPPLNDSKAIPILKPNDGFISTNKTWSYEIDGTIRTAFNKKIDSMGSCLQALENKNLNMTENIDNCSKWTWNAKGQLMLRGGTKGKDECLSIGNFKSGGKTIQGAYVSDCNNSPHQVWSFFPGKTATATNN